MKCKQCGSEMKAISHECKMVELDDEATEGQMADYTAAEESGDFGDWSVTEVIYECKKCGNVVVIEE